MDILIAKKYRLDLKIGEGGFGEVYKATHVKTKKELAIKLEKRTEWNPILPYESKILEYLKGVEGVPNIIEWGFQSDFNYLAMDLAGVSLEDKFKDMGGGFSTKVNSK